LKLFLDTGSLVALHNKEDEHHEEASQLFEQIGSGSLKITKLYCSDYVLDESITTCYARTRSRKAAVQLGTAVLESKSIVLLRVDDKAFDQSWELFRDKYQDLALSFTDCTTYILSQLHNIPNIFSFDSDFEALGLNLFPK